MANKYGVAFSQTDPRTYPSLAPTFLAFNSMVDGSAISPPAISQFLAAGATYTGIYQFTYTASFSVYFLLDGITVATSTDRYVYGILDPIQQVDLQLERYTATFTAANSTLVAYGNTNVALGTSNIALGVTNFALGVTITAQNVSLDALGISIYEIASAGASSVGDLSGIGNTTSSFGDINTDPGTLFGYVKRIQEFLEGQATFTKLSGEWNVMSRGGSLLASKALTNTSSMVTKD